MKLYRYRESFYTSNRIYVFLEEFDVTRRTAKGAWIATGGGDRFVLLTAHKKFACATPADAWESFIARKRCQVRILTAQLKKAKEVLALAEAGKTETGKTETDTFRLFA